MSDFLGSIMDNYDSIKTTPPEVVYKPVYDCCMCDEGIYDGDEYLDLGGELYCKECVEKMMQIAWED